MQTDMTDLGTRIRERRRELGLTQAELGERVGMKQQSIQSVEDGKAQRPRKLREIARALRTSEAFLLGETSNDEGPLEERLSLTPNASEPHPVPLMSRTIPILGRGAGGVDGMFVLNGEKVGEVRAIPPLEQVPNAYAVYVFGDSMEPRFSSGEIVYVDPVRPPRRGDDVVVQLKAERDGDPPAGYIKRFLRQTADQVVLQQFNPEQEVTFPAERVFRIHVIVGLVTGG